MKVYKYRDYPRRYDDYVREARKRAYVAIAMLTFYAFIFLVMAHRFIVVTN